MGLASGLDSETAALPPIDAMHIPSVMRTRVDQWYRMDRARRLSICREAAETYSDQGPDAAMRLEWWNVVANLSVAPFLVYDDER